MTSTQPFRHLLESVYAIEDDKTVPLPVVLPGQRSPRMAKAAYALPAIAPPPRLDTAPVPVVSDDLDDRAVAPAARPTQENLLVTKSSRFKPADAPSTDVDHSAETFNKEEEEASIADIAGLIGESAPDTTTTRRAPVTAIDIAIDLSLDSLDVLSVLPQDESLNDRLSALPMLLPVGGAHEGLVVARSEATGIWSKNNPAEPAPAFGDDSFNRLLSGPDDWFDVPLPADEQERPVVAPVPTVDIRPLPARAISDPDVPVVLGELVPTPPLIVRRPRRPIAPTIPTPAPQMDAPAPQPEKAAPPPARAATAPSPRPAPKREAPRAAPVSRADQDRTKLAEQFYHAAVTAVASRNYADALARLAGAHNLAPNNKRYTAMIEDVKAMMRRAA